MQKKILKVENADEGFNGTEQPFNLVKRKKFSSSITYNLHFPL